MFWSTRSQPERRRPARTEITQIERLETRLCLGGLTTPDLGTWTGDVFDDPLPPRELTIAETLDELNGEDSATTDQPAQGNVPQQPQHHNPSTAKTASTAIETDSTLGDILPDHPLDEGDGDPSDTTAAKTGDTAPATGREVSHSPPQQPGAANTSTSTADFQLSETGAPGMTSAPARDHPQIASPASTNESAPLLGPITVKYDFRNQGQHENLITQEQQGLAVRALDMWSEATGGKLSFVHDTSAPAADIINIGTGDLGAFGFSSGAGGTIGLGGGGFVTVEETRQINGGFAWLDVDETWDTSFGNGDVSGTVDYFTVVSHEVGHALGLPDVLDAQPGDVMGLQYRGELTGLSSTDRALVNSLFVADSAVGESTSGRAFSMGIAGAQLTQAEVAQLLDRGAAATASDDAIIAVVDREGNILGVRVEGGVPIAAGDTDTLVFAIDGAVAKARTAAFFSNGDPTNNADTISPNGTLAPLTSRLVRFVSQTTITQREVESNPNVSDPDSTVRGPGFVAPIGLGGHFPPGVMHTPPVDLFAIEHTNRDSLTHPGPDLIKGTADDILLPARFNADFVPGQEINAPESYGTVSGRLPDAQSRGIATLPGGIPLFRDTNGDGVGETLIGGIGVFFPGPDGYATFEQGFVAGIGQTELQRTNAPRVLESEYIAFAAIGSSALAGVSFGAIVDSGGVSVAPVSGIDLPFGRLDLVGIQLPVLGPTAGRTGIRQIVDFGRSLGVGDKDSGADQPIDLGMDGMVGGGDDTFYADGQVLPDGWLVAPTDSQVDNLTAADVRRIINQGVAEARQVRAAVRLPLSSRTRMVFAVTDTAGEVLGLFRMQDATFFSIDVATAKARNTAYYADASVLQAADQVPGVSAGVAFTNRTFRFLAEPRYPSGVEGSVPPAFSMLNHASINARTGENIGAPAAASSFTSVKGFDAFNPGSNFRDPGDTIGGTDLENRNQNGIVFFPGSTPLYKNGALVGGLGVSGDGVDQDDVVTFAGAQGFLPPADVLRADQVKVRGVRLPYIKFLRNPRQ